MKVEAGFLPAAGLVCPTARVLMLSSSRLRSISPAMGRSVSLLEASMTVLRRG
jgi:hypothetical protein